MVFNHQTSLFPAGFRTARGKPLKHTCLLFVLALFVSACGQDSSTQNAANSPGNSNGVDNANSGQGNDQAQSGNGNPGTSGNNPVNNDSIGGAPVAGTVDTLAIPVALSLQTLEDVPVSGLFSVDNAAIAETGEVQNYSIVSRPEHGTLTHAVGSRPFTYEPFPDYFGTDQFVYRIANGRSAVVQLNVINVNDAPSITDDVRRVVDQGDAYTDFLDATDIDGDPLTFTASNLPSWLKLDAVTGVLLGNPTQQDIGVYENIEFTVTDPGGLSAILLGVQIEVVDVNDPPTLNLSQFPSNLDAGDQISINVFPDDPDDDPVQVSVEPNENLTISVSGSTVSLTVNEVVQVAKVDLEIVARDALGDITREIVPLTLHPLSSSGRGRTLKGRSVGEGIHLVVLGDGYQQDQQQQYRDDVLHMMTLMQRDPSINTHFDAWNVHMVETPSVDSGIDDNVLRDSRNTVFNTGYFCRQVRRLICGDQLSMYDVAITEYPNFDAIMVLVNDSRYGGGGGNVAIASTSSPEIALHELGHSFAGLADEYVDRYIPEGSQPPYVEGLFANVSTNSNPADVPWSHWLTNNELVANVLDEVGVFEGAFYRPTGFFRPTQNSLMRAYDGQLGPVNGEQWALRVYASISPVLDISPATTLIQATVGEQMEFSVEPLFGPAVRSVEWRLDGALVAHTDGDKPTVTIALNAGTYNMELVVRDVTGQIRKPEPHGGVFQRDWTIVVR